MDVILDVGQVSVRDPRSSLLQIADSVQVLLRPTLPDIYTTAAQLTELRDLLAQAGHREYLELLLVDTLETWPRADIVKLTNVDVSAEIVHDPRSAAVSTPAPSRAGADPQLVHALDHHRGGSDPRPHPQASGTDRRAPHSTGDSRMTNPEQPTPQQPSLTELPMFLTQPDPAAIPGHRPRARGCRASARRRGGPQYSRRGATPAPQPAPSPTPRAGSRYEDDDEQVDWTLLQSLRKEVAELLDRSVAVNPTMTEQDQRAIAQSHALDVIRDRMNAVTAETGDRNAWSAAMQQRLARAVIDRLYGLGRFQPLVDDPTVKNVDIYGNDRVYVKYADGRKVLMPPITPTDQDLIEEIRLIAMRKARTPDRSPAPTRSCRWTFPAASVASRPSTRRSRPAPRSSCASTASSTSASTSCSSSAP
jgi:hypothetical protein